MMECDLEKLVKCIIINNNSVCKKGKLIKMLNNERIKVNPVCNKTSDFKAAFMNIHIHEQNMVSYRQQWNNV